MGDRFLPAFPYPAAFQAWLPASRNLGYYYHCHVFWMGRSLCSYWHVFLWRCSIREQDSFKMEILKKRSSSSPQGPTNKRNHKNRMRVDGEWNRTDGNGHKTPSDSYGIPSPNIQTPKLRSTYLNPQKPPALRIMGCQNCWCGDPRTLLYRVKPSIGGSNDS